MLIVNSLAAFRIDSTFTKTFTNSLPRCSHTRERDRQSKSFYTADGDLLVSGLVVLTSGTSVRTFSFIHFSHFYGFSGLSVCRSLLT